MMPGVDVRGAAANEYALPFCSSNGEIRVLQVRYITKQIQKPAAAATSYARSAASSRLTNGWLAADVLSCLCLSQRDSSTVVATNNPRTSSSAPRFSKGAARTRRGWRACRGLWGFCHTPQAASALPLQRTPSSYVPLPRRCAVAPSN